MDANNLFGVYPSIVGTRLDDCQTCHSGKIEDLKGRPHTTHTSSTPAIEGTWPVVSDGWTKIDAPMMVPATIAVA